MRGEFTKGRKPEILTIINHDYDIHEIDTKVFRYLCNCDPKIFVMEESHFFFEDLVRGKVPYWCKTYFRTKTGKHNQNQTCILITQFTRDIPTKIINAFSQGIIFYLPPREIEYLHEIRFLEDDPKYVNQIISPFQSYKFYDVGARVRGYLQPCRFM